MNFFIALVLIFLPLEISHQVHAGEKHEPFKFIFNKGILVSDSTNVRAVTVKYVGDVLVITVFHDNHRDQMVITKENANWDDLSFVIESLDYTDNPNVCDESTLKNLIKSCEGQIRLREITKDEEKQSSELAQELEDAEGNPMKMKIIYNQDHMITVSTDTEDLKIEKYPKSMVVEHFSAETKDSSSPIYAVIESAADFDNESFVLQTVNAPSDQNCFIDTDDTLTFSYCLGNIAVRPPTDAEKKEAA